MSLIDRAHQAVVDGLRGNSLTGIEPRTAAADFIRGEQPLASSTQVGLLVQRVMDRLEGMDLLEGLLADDAVTDVMVNGPGSVWIERNGAMEETSISVDPDELARLIERVTTATGRRVDRASPRVDARLPDGSRVNVVLPPVAVDGPYLTIRRFRNRSFTLSEFAPPAVAELLERAVVERRNVVLSGGTGAGKTSLLNAMCRHIPMSERVVTIEDAAELRLPLPQVVRLEARSANAEGIGEVTIRELVHNALRMRPDRLIVGEARGAEALDVLQAMNTGHDGSLTTVHANSPAAALDRLHTLTLMAASGLTLAAVERHVASAVDLIVHVARRPDGTRRVVSVEEVTGPDLTRPIGDANGVVGELTRPPRT